MTDDESGESIEYLVLDSDAVLLIFLLSTHRLQVDKCLLQPQQTPCTVHTHDGTEKEQ